MKQQKIGPDKLWETKMKIDNKGHKLKNFRIDYVVRF